MNVWLEYEDVTCQHCSFVTYKHRNGYAGLHLYCTKRGLYVDDEAWCRDLEFDPDIESGFVAFFDPA